MIRGLFKLMILTSLVLLVTAVFVFLELRALSEQPVQLEPNGVEYEVPPGFSASQLLRDWQQRGWITASPYYRFYFHRYPEQAAIKSGQYHLPAGESLHSLLLRIIKGDVLSYPFTIIEGWNIYDLRRALQRAPHLQKQTTAMDDIALMEAIGSPGLHPEGQFYPETYRYTASESDLDILRRAHKRLQKELDEAWQQRQTDLPYQWPYEALIMASIVEKETAVPAEREQIAGVFVRRLQRGMRLQTDPTVIYGMGQSYDGNIRKKDLRTDTAYNTYTRGGLPPTPIAMPTRASIEAALHPDDGEALYFVARGDGSHVFSATLEQHNRAVADYLKTLRQKRRR